jgi:predicted Zn-dependent protease
MIVVNVFFMFCYFIFSFTIQARMDYGHETGNGGDSHISRYLLAQHIAQVTTNRTSEAKVKQLFTDLELEKVTLKYIKKWPQAISELEFEEVDEMLYENNKEKAAIHVDHSSRVLISKAYFEKHTLSLDEVITIVIHEAGHKLGISNHKSLDYIGMTFVNEVFRKDLKSEQWKNYLIFDRSVKSAFDRKLIAVAYEYLYQGEGANLASTIYYFTRNNLRDSGLSQMFRYLAQYRLGINIKNIIPEEEFRIKVEDLFAKEFILFCRSLSPEKSLGFVKYGMAKLKKLDRLYTENIYDFDLLAKRIDAIVRADKPIEKSVVEFKEMISKNFFYIL